MNPNILFTLVLIVLSGCATPGQEHARATSALEQVFEQRGFTMLRNPVSNYIPGTLLFTPPTEARGSWLIACNAEDVLPEIRNKTSTSNTSTFSVNLTDRNSIKGNLSLVDLADTVAQNAATATIKLKIENPIILEIAHSSLQGERVGQGCLDHLNIKTGAEVKGRLLMIMAALQADISVDVTFDKEAGLSVEAEKELLNKISSTLPKGVSGSVKIERKTNGSASLTGEKLIWAVRADQESANFFLLGQGR